MSDEPVDYKTEMDDHIVASIVAECLEVMRKHTSYTVSKMTACYNLTERTLRLFSIQGSKEDLHAFIDEFHERLKKDIDEYYYEDE